MESSSGSGWKKPLLIGCVLLSVLGIGAMVIVLMNWTSISGFVAETTGTLKELVAVRTALQERFRAPQVSVKVKKTSNVEGTILSIEVVNAPFFRELMIDAEEGRLMAFDMAGTARAALSEQTHFAFYEVIFNNRSGAGLKISRTRVYSFEEKTLQPPPTFIRSGTDANDDVDEPLRAEAMRYETALKTSNTGIEHLRAGDFKSAYAMCSAELHATMGEAEFEDLMKQIADKVGPVARYKPMQWKFALRESEGRRFLYSTKIVEHERGVLNYNFIFDADGDYKAPVGLRWNSRSVENETGAPK